MITSVEYYQNLIDLDIKYASGVPCSVVSGLINLLGNSDKINYIPAPREDIAISIASGLSLTGEIPLVIMQNSGLGTSLDAIITQPLLYGLPMVMLITWRGYYKNNLVEKGDEIQHWIWGDTTKKLLENIDIKTWIMDDKNQLNCTEFAINYAKKYSTAVAILVKRHKSIDEKR